MVFLKLVHMEYQVNHKTQPFWVKVIHLVPNVQTLAGRAIYPFGTNNYPPFRHSTKNQVFSPTLDFLFFTKIRLELTNHCVEIRHK